MNLRSSRLSAFAAVSVFVLSGCASVPQTGAQVGATEIKVYDSNQFAPSQYEVVRRIWVDSWRAAFWLPTYPSEAEGIAALRTEAGRLGANGLINVICIDQGRSQWPSSLEPRVLCYGNAIRVGRNQG